MDSFADYFEVSNDVKWYHHVQKVLLEDMGHESTKDRVALMLQGYFEYNMVHNVSETTG